MQLLYNKNAMLKYITIHLFQAVYTGHSYFGRFWEIVAT